MSLFKKIKDNGSLLLMTLPAAVLIFTFSYLPMFGLVIAFKDYKYNKGIFGSSWSGLQNFQFLFKSGDAFVITRNTLLYNLVFIIVGMVLAVALAILFDALGKSKLMRFNQTASILPYFLSWVVIGYFVNSFLNSEKGLLNQALVALGGNAVEWYSEQKYWPYIIPLVHFWKVLGYNSIIYYSTIRGFDTEFYEAAQIDGATWFQRLFHVTLPLLKPILIVMLILSIGSIFNTDFGLFYIIPKNSGALYPVTSTVDTYVYNSMMRNSSFGMSSAASFLQSFVGFGLVLTANAIIRRVSPEDAMF